MINVFIKNLTESALVLNTLGVSGHQVVASGTANLTEGNAISEIQGNTELLGHISSGNAVLVINNIEKTLLESTHFVTTVATTSTPISFSPPNPDILYSVKEVYTVGAKMKSGEIQYTKVWMYKGSKISSFKTFLVNDSSFNISLLSGKKIRFGLYDQVDLLNPTGIPNSRLVETGDMTLDGSKNKSWLIENLSTPYSIPYDGYYWLAIISDGNPRLSSTLAYEEGFVSTIWETSVGANLPATASGLFSQKSAILYNAAIIEV